MNTLERITRAVKAMKPAGEHTARWTMICLGLFFVILEIDIMWNGAIYKIWRSVWEHFIITHPSIPYWLGVISCWLIMRRKKQLEDRRKIGGKDSDPTPLKNDAVDLSTRNLKKMSQLMSEKK